MKINNCLIFSRHRRCRLLLFLTIITIFFFCSEQLPPDYTGPKKEVLIKPGMSVMEVATVLKEKNIVNSVTIFRLLAWFYNYDRRIQPGRYRFVPNSDPKLVLRMLAREIPAFLFITIPEGATRQQIARILHENGICDQDSFLNASADPELLRSLNIPFPTAEGYLFPETYEFQTGTDAPTLVKRLVHQFRSTYQTLKRDAPTSLTESQVVILASIVEKEAKIPEEFPIIAGVFLNRLHRGIPLQSCATVQYILPEHKERLSLDDLKTQSPYNTYLHPGLPPGPICNPGRTALRAVLFPTRHDYLFFVAKGNGSHIFSKTPQEHESATKRLKQN
uniref:Endolytic murein transglycosylase n=1 Tax=candidate division WOR-3 bacterium TaxID=2052148 RepID=A0A7V3PTE1_UNCW3